MDYIQLVNELYLLLLDDSPRLPEKEQCMIPVEYGHSEGEALGSQKFNISRLLFPWMFYLLSNLFCHTSPVNFGVDKEWGVSKNSVEFFSVLSVELVAWFPYYSISCLPNTPPILEERKALSGEFDMFFILSNDLSVLTWITKFYLGSIMCRKRSQSMLVHDAYRSPLT